MAYSQVEYIDRRTLLLRRGWLGNVCSSLLINQKVSHGMLNPNFPKTNLLM